MQYILHTIRESQDTVPLGPLAQVDHCRYYIFFSLLSLLIYLATFIEYLCVTMDMIQNTQCKESSLSPVLIAAKTSEQGHITTET